MSDDPLKLIGELAKMGRLVIEQQHAQVLEVTLILPTSAAALPISCIAHTPSSLLGALDYVHRCAVQACKERLKR